MMSTAAKQSLRVAFAIGTLFVSNGVTYAEGAPAGLAMAGPCAEPRDAIAGVGDPDFSVVGPLQSLFSPVDVAAGPAPVLREPRPSVRKRPRPGPCDQPGSGCGVVLRPVRVAGTPPAGNSPAGSGNPPPFE